MLYVIKSILKRKLLFVLFVLFSIGMCILLIKRKDLNSINENEQAQLIQ